MLDGCDFEHWLIMMEKPEGEPSREEIIDSYIKTLAKIVGRLNNFYRMFIVVVSNVSCLWSYSYV